MPKQKACEHDKMNISNNDYPFDFDPFNIEDVCPNLYAIFKDPRRDDGRYDQLLDTINYVVEMQTDLEKLAMSPESLAEFLTSDQRDKEERRLELLWDNLRLHIAEKSAKFCADKEWRNGEYVWRQGRFGSLFEAELEA